MSLRNMTSHSPDSIGCLLLQPKETPPQFGTRAPLPKEPFPSHCQKRRMALCGACFHTKPMLASLSILSTSCSPSALFTQPSSLILVTRTLTLLSPTLSSLTTCSQLPSGAFSPPLRSCPRLCPCPLPSVAGAFCLSPAVSLRPPGPSWDTIILGSSQV